MAKKNIDFEDPRYASQLFGPQNENLSAVAARTGTAIDSRGNQVFISSESGDSVAIAEKALRQMYGLVSSGRTVTPQDIECACRILEREPDADVENIFEDTVYAVSTKKAITPKTLSQHAYLKSIRASDLTLAIGPAGTGKTYMAVAMAVAALTRREVKRIILTRPAVEAGEKLGFLPGDLVEKVNPYLRPLYDALNDMMDFRKVAELMQEGAIEVAPLAFMRGRTLNDAFVILDEAQNTTPEQMKMFLTRLGFGSKAVVTGDVTQIDLPTAQVSGLIHAERILKDVEGIASVHFHDDDVIRHPLVGRIVRAYEKHNGGKGNGHGGEGG